MVDVSRRKFVQKSLSMGLVAMVPAGLAGCGNSGSSQALARSAASTSATDGPTLIALIDGKEVNRAEVLVWEARRLKVVAERMQGNMPAAMLDNFRALFQRPLASTENIALAREAMADAKMALGSEKMKQLVSGDLMISDYAGALAATPKEWAVSEIEIYSNKGTAKGFTEWYGNAVAMNDQRAMLRACPDHYVLESVGENGQYVVEETGGAQVVTQFTIDYTKPSNLPVAFDPMLVYKSVGPAINEQGVQIGGVGHQFGELETGFVSRLAVFFPATLPDWYVTEHRWHLACEFSNWIEDYLSGV